ncbi:MAG: Ig-like domain-containing protein, partial [Pseudomonadota bacterium]
IWAIPPISTQIVVLAPDLTELQRIDFNQLSKIDPLNGDVTNAFNDANERPISVSVTQDDILYITTGAEVFSYDLMRRQPDNTNLFLRLPPIVQNPNFNEVDTATTEPWASYNKFLGGKYVDMVVDSSGDLYISDPSESRIWKFQGVRLNADRSLQQPPSFVGWAGRCDANLDPSVLACDTTLETSIGFSCEDDLCGASINVGSARGQFFGVRGIAMSPQDVLYATDTRNSRVQRFTTDGEFAGEAVSECGGSCFVLGDFGFVTNVAVNSNNFYLLDQDNDLTHIYETTPITDIDDQTMSQTQTAFVTYKSNEGYTGPDSFSFIAYDGLAYSDEAAVDINVTRNFRPPIATPGLTVAGLEDAPLPLPLSGLDRDGDTLDFAVDTPPANGTVTRGANGLVYTPNENFFGEDTFTYVATDAPTSVPAMTSAPELVTVVVAPVNDVPVLSAEPLDVQPFVYESRIEALLRDVDLDDRHRIAIDWGDGSISDSLSDAISLGRDNGIVRILADHSFTQTTNPGSPSTVTICASDVPSTARLTCASSDVTATLQLPVTVERLVDLRVDIDDSLPKTSDPDVPEIQISDPLLDGGEPVTYTVEIQNFIPSQSDFRPSATDVTAMLQVPNEMTLLSVVTPDGNCTSSGRQIDCNFGDISPDAAVVVDVTAVGSGTLIDDADATLQVEVFAAEANVGEDNAGSWLTELKLNGDLDADGDGVPNRDDAFPGDPTETADNDADGIGDNADLDDDNDTLPDGWEDRFGLDRLDPADRAGDLDADGLTNETEFAMGTRPDQVDSDRDAVGDAADNCPLLFNGQQFDANGDGRGDPCDPISYVGAVDVGDVDGDGEADVTLVTAMLNNTAAVTKSAATDFDIVAFTQVSGNPAPQAALPLRLSNDEVAVATPIRRSDGVLGGRTVNGWTGELVQQYSAFTQSFSFVAADVARSSSAEDALVILAESETSSIRADRRPASAATKDGDMTFFAGRPRFKPLGFAMIDYDVAVVLAHDNGNLVVQAREFGADSASNSTVGEWPIPSADWLDARVGALDDGFVVLTTNVDGSSTVSRWRLSDNASVLTFDLAAGEGTTVAISTGAGGPPMLRVVAADAAGDVTLLTYDLITGLQIQSTDVIDNLREVRAGLNQLPGRYGVLASDRTGAVTLELKDTLTGNTVTTLTAESMSPAPPPPPPPPPPPTTPPPGNSGGGGGGGAVGGWIVFTFAGLVAATHRRRRAIAARNN